MKVSSSKIFSYMFYAVIILCLGFLVSFRDPSIGTDTLAYKNYFINIDYYHAYGRHEVLFHYLNYIISYIFNNYFIFICFLFLFFNFFLLVTINNFILSNKKYYIISVISLLGFSLLSSWYQVATLNGIRQGTSLILLYAACSFFYKNNKLLGIIFLLFSIGFHGSTILVLPFLLFLYCRLRNIFILFLIVSLFYPLGINEKIIYYISIFTNLPVYSLIYNYAEGLDSWVGFQLNFYLYSVFFAIFFFVLYNLFLKENSAIEWSLKIFLILIIVYFIFGFGVYSNRFGFMAWLFLPIIQTLYFTYFFCEKYFKIGVVFGLIILFLGILNYLNVLNVINIL